MSTQSAMTAAHEAPQEEYRRERAPCSPEFQAELTRITGDIGDPVAKLRYLRGALDDGGAESSVNWPVNWLPYAPARRAWYRFRGLEALDALADSGSAQPPVGDATLVARTKARRVATGALAAGLLFVPALLAGLALQMDSRGEASALALAKVAAPAPAVHPSSPPLEPISEGLAADTLGIVPTTIFLADRGPDWELYSNGLRIETSHAVKGTERRYRVHQRDGGLQAAEYSQPVGILFHTSESDLWPLEPGFERQLRRTAAGLLKYLRDAESYNYLIDRFGRVYRIVADESRANHAGHSVWARDDEVYLDLNAAFLGVSFESRWEGGRTLPITRAQLIAGRNLTHLLRQRFAIAPEMCVTHGLTSVSPKQGLIGYHRDWARGFPFEAFGLPDLYAQPPPSVALFGFGHDDEFMRAVGERWPGLIAAERLFAQQATERSVAIETLRRERQALYRQWSREPEAGESVAREPSAPSIPDKRG
jgi:hypothetical protein